MSARSSSSDATAAAVAAHYAQTPEERTASIERTRAKYRGQGTPLVSRRFVAGAHSPAAVVVDGDSAALRAERALAPSRASSLQQLAAAMVDSEDRTIALVADLAAHAVRLAEMRAAMQGRPFAERIQARAQLDDAFSRTLDALSRQHALTRQSRTYLVSRATSKK